jgi:hypothetical protein
MQIVMGHWKQEKAREKRASTGQEISVGMI